MRLTLRPLLVCCLLLLSGCGYTSIRGASEEVQAAWVEVLSQYRYREQLIPALTAQRPH